MAPDIADQDDAPSGSLGRAALAFLLIVGVCGALAAIFYRVMVWLNAHHAGYWAVMGATAVYGALILGVVAIWMRTKSVQTCMVASEAAKRHRRRMSIAAVAYVAALMLAITGYKQLHLGGVLAYAAALLPALPLAGMFVSMGFYLRDETDEFQRQVQIEASLWATGAVMAICAGWGFLQMFDLAPHVELWVVVPAWCLFLGLANALIRRRYR